MNTVVREMCTVGLVNRHQQLWASKNPLLIYHRPATVFVLFSVSPTWRRGIQIVSLYLQPTGLYFGSYSYYFNLLKSTKITIFNRQQLEDHSNLSCYRLNEYNQICGSTVRSYSLHSQFLLRHVSKKTHPNYPRLWKKKIGSTSAELVRGRYQSDTMNEDEELFLLGRVC